MLIIIVLTCSSPCPPQFWAAYVPCESQFLNAVQLTIEQLDLIRRLVDQYPDHLQLAMSAAGNAVYNILLGIRLPAAGNDRQR